MLGLAEWVERQEKQLTREYEEDQRRCPTVEGLNFDQYQGPSAFIQYHASLDPYPLQTLQKAGYAVKGLHILEMQAQVGPEKAQLVLGRESGRPLGPDVSAFRTRDIVALADHGLHVLCQANVTSITHQTINILLCGLEVDELEAVGPFVLIRSGSDATHRYLNNTLSLLKGQGTPWRKQPTDDYLRVKAYFIDLILGKATPEKVDLEYTRKHLKIPPELGLNEKQREAVWLVNSSAPLAVIWGPAGTGKTTTLSAALALYSLSNPGKRVLVCAPSNTATDNLVLGVKKALGKLNVSTDQLLRIGTTARTTTELVFPFLAGSRLSEEHASELKSARTALTKAEAGYAKAKTKLKAMGGDKQHLYACRDAVRAAMKDLAVAQKEGLERIYGSRIIFATLSGVCSEACSRAARSSGGFDLVVIDEAGQALDVALASAILMSKARLVLAGDPKQLTPTVLTDGAKGDKVFSKPFMARLVENPALAETSSLIMLEKQYRFNKEICAFPSSIFYDGKLVPDASNAEISLSDPKLLGPEWFDLCADDAISRDPRVIFLDTSSAEYDETRQDGSGVIAPQLSIYNEGEAELVTRFVKYLLSKLELAGLEAPAHAIGCISPYSAQVSLLQSKLADSVEKGLEISTVDSFQGREKEIIIISMTRSNSDHDLGFLTDQARINVSITRAKRLLVIVGNSLMFEGDSCLDVYCKHLLASAVILLPTDLDTE
ncbi:DNA helicase HCS1 [Giardia muris]|uniref:DNA helicase HCS1 n=1 Tax=Giardia muris TaxID=5742 RepID=A0A4Z1TB45_GIAMU|nr:DNA helicase HCS1 [Giardia muris]|eukprot:TNJ29751.1 DNA helicase HCS1 [Giardia muris]